MAHLHSVTSNIIIIFIVMPVIVIISTDKQHVYCKAYPDNESCMRHWDSRPSGFLSRMYVSLRSLTVTSNLFLSNFKSAFFHFWFRCESNSKNKTCFLLLFYLAIMPWLKTYTFLWASAGRPVKHDMICHWPATPLTLPGRDCQSLSFLS